MKRLRKHKWAVFFIKLHRFESFFLVFHSRFNVRTHLHNPVYTLLDAFANFRRGTKNSAYPSSFANHACFGSDTTGYTSLNCFYQAIKRCSIKPPFGVRLTISRGDIDCPTISPIPSKNVTYSAVARLCELRLTLGVARVHRENSLCQWEEEAHS